MVILILEYSSMAFREIVLCFLCAANRSHQYGLERVASGTSGNIIANKHMDLSNQMWCVNGGFASVWVHSFNRANTIFRYLESFTLGFSSYTLFILLLYWFEIFSRRSLGLWTKSLFFFHEAPKAFSSSSVKSLIHLNCLGFWFKYFFLMFDEHT